MRIAIIDYGSGNTQSVKYALKRLGCESVLTSDKEVISSSDKVIFPGVGQASSAMSKLKFKGLDVLIPCLLYTSPSPRDVEESRMPSSA